MLKKLLIIYLTGIVGITIIGNLLLLGFLYLVFFVRP
jgi:hypothetical protein